MEKNTIVRRPCLCCIIQAYYYMHYYTQHGKVLVCKGITIACSHKFFIFPFFMPTAQELPTLQESGNLKDTRNRRHPELQKTLRRRKNTFLCSHPSYWIHRSSSLKMGMNFSALNWSFSWNLHLRSSDKYTLFASSAVRP